MSVPLGGCRHLCRMVCPKVPTSDQRYRQGTDKVPTRYRHLDVGPSTKGTDKVPTRYRQGTDIWMSVPLSVPPGGCRSLCRPLVGPLSVPWGCMSVPCRSLVGPCRSLVGPLSVPCRSLVGPLGGGGLPRNLKSKVCRLDFRIMASVGTLSVPCRYLVGTLSVPLSDVGTFVGINQD